MAMGNQDFLTYLNAKYTETELTNIHHYETKIIRDSSGTLIQPEGKRVPSGHTVNFLDNGTLRSESSLTSFTFLEHETNLNDAKRNINILRPEFLGLFLENFADIMEYKPSKQFVTDKLKKTENPRVIYCIKKEVTLSDLWRKNVNKIFSGYFLIFSEEDCKI